MLFFFYPEPHSFFIVLVLLWRQGGQWTGRLFTFGVMSIHFLLFLSFGSRNKLFQYSDAKRVSELLVRRFSWAFFGSTTARYFSSEICGKSSISDLGPISLIFFSIACLFIAILVSRSLTSSSTNNNKAVEEDEVVGGSSVEAFKI
ncbi:MAG: hypothetical protein CM1200mP12_14370 [Gammaproteobacteria bacterium]|nr:MAG: hypothetical protein CM1200mP12_14370 [Gammaproteobacteria bacterium]